jgi:hypothetical protein
MARSVVVTRSGSSSNTNNTNNNNNNNNNNNSNRNKNSNRVVLGKENKNTFNLLFMCIMAQESGL